MSMSVNDQLKFPSVFTQLRMAMLGAINSKALHTYSTTSQPLNAMATTLVRILGEIKRNSLVSNE